jgi:hypothetical protein
VEALAGATHLIVYGQICPGPDSAPTFDPQSGIPRCTGGVRGTTASVTIALTLGAGTDSNHNPVADRGFTFDGQAWSRAAAGDDPCASGPRVAAASKGHVIGGTTLGTDREVYTALVGDPPQPKQRRESLQVSQFTTAGKMKSQFSFVEASDDAPESPISVKWDAPEASEVPTTGRAVTFTFVVRDDRGGIDWATRSACVTP